MVHGPCGDLNKQCKCMKDGKCSKFFPKNYQDDTVVGEDGFVQYRRRAEIGNFVERYGVKLDNAWVVPYNLKLLKRFQAHINVEWCNKTHIIKYLFKYITKGPDRVRAVIESFGAHNPTRNLEAGVNSNDFSAENSSVKEQTNDVDEVREYIDCRYLSSHEAVWRLFEFDIHYRVPAVERLAVHLPLMNSIVYPAKRSLVDIVDDPRSRKSTLTEWFSANKIYPNARELTYIEFPTKWVWDKKEKHWHSRRSTAKKIGRAIYINPSCGELYYLRMLLNVVKGATSYEDLRTVHGVLYPSFKDACQALVLLGDDNEWREALREASLWGSATQMRQLFVTIVLFCSVCDALSLFNEFYIYFTDDIHRKIQSIIQLLLYTVPEQHLKNHVLVEFDNLFTKNGASMSNYGLPKPDLSLLSKVKNRLLAEEMAYDVAKLKNEHDTMIKQLNGEQKHIYDTVIRSVYDRTGECFFVYGYGGTGKTFL
jgi:hypothetical protein